MARKVAKKPSTSIALNKKARFDFFIEEKIEAGISLEGWEVKSLRAGKAQLTESYVVVRKAEIWILGAYLTPLASASTHIDTDPARTRKLLLHRKEIDRLSGLVDRKGYTLVPLELYWNRGRAKLSIGLAKGKKQYDKRSEKKKQDWERDKARALKAINR
jgi:SsrA-binding protein|tara:strand:+ start:1236 stop:1715 length:480 start_codon:yes stop_codon:yes gene_type:complete